MMHNMTHCVVPAVVLTAIFAAPAAAQPQAPATGQQQAQQTPSARFGDWIAEPGYALDVDSEGFHLPTAIAFVPSPGSAPGDPLYFVTELRGTVKVVTNDRSVHVFATDFFRLVPRRELPEIEGQVGLAGLCLDPERGYVFVTFAHEDSAGVLRNNVMRFTSTPVTFSLAPTAQRDFAHVFAGAEATSSHQVGACRVLDGQLYVSVGDAAQPARSQDTTSVLGKILRLTPDGEAVAANRFYRPPEGLTRFEQGAGYIWSYGFRNPFGMVAVGGELFVAENGDNIDRFLQVRGGENYLWDGTDLSIGARADVVFSPPIGPVHLDYVSGDVAHNAFDGLRGDFFTAASAEARPGIVRIPWSLAERRAAGPPSFLVRYQGAGIQIAAGVAVGPDGIYFAPMLPDRNGRTPVLRIASAPGLADSADPDGMTLMERYGCLGCHRLGREGGSVGPRLDRDSLLIRLERDHGARTPAERLRWTASKIVDPKFDNPAAEMPTLGVAAADAERIAGFLVGAGEGAARPGIASRFVNRLRDRIPRPVMLRHFVIVGVASFAAGALLLAAAVGLFMLTRRDPRP
jgi:glucose/arabinose dehydrogenase